MRHPFFLKFTAISVALLSTLLVGGCGGGSGGADAGGVTIVTQDLTPNLRLLLINTGTLAGGFHLMKDDDRLNWYFCNTGLQPFVTVANNAMIKNYLDLFLRQVDRSGGVPTGTIQDYKSISGLTKQTPDSNDAYISTFLILAARYRTVSGDKAWWTANVTDMKTLAHKALSTQQKTSGLIKAKITGSDTGFLIDNCENYAGLKAFANFLATDADPAAPEFATATANVAMGVTNLFSNTTHSFQPADIPSATTFYPDRVAQVFPQLYDVPTGDADYQSAWIYLSARGDKWEEGQIKDASLGPPGAQFPWMVLGAVAAKRGEVNRAQEQFAFYRRNLDQATPPPVFTAIQEIGFATVLQNLSAK